MTRIDIGIDPDSDKNGVAVYIDGKLSQLHSLDIVETFNILFGYKKFTLNVHIENLFFSSSSAFNYKNGDCQAVKGKKSEGVGRCKQAQHDIEVFCKHYKINIFHHRPCSTWKDSKSVKLFQKVTGWGKRGNADTRSAAYFGYTGSRMNSLALSNHPVPSRLSK